MSVELLCSCGKRFNVPDAHAGRRVKCPTCGAVTEVPAPGAAASAAPGRGGLPRLWLLIGLLALLVAAGGSGLAWWLTHREPVAFEAEKDGPEVTDVQLIPPGAQGFATVRLAELWALPEVKETIAAARQEDPDHEDLVARMERETGLTPDEVERLHVVSIDAQRRLGWIVGRTVSPPDRKRILSRLRTPVEQWHEGRRYFLGKTEQGREVAVHFGGPQVLVVASEEGMKLCLEQAGKPATTGPLTPIITLVEGKSQVVLGINPKGPLQELLKKNETLKELGGVQLLRLTADVGKEASLDLRATTEDEAAAKKLNSWLLAWKKKASNPFWLIGGAALLGLDAAVVEQIAKLLAKFKPQVKGNEVAVQVKTDTASLVKGLLLAAKQVK
jgi:hypothetical protein